MLKALLKKQFLSVLGKYAAKKRRNGKPRGMLGVAAILALLALLMGAGFYAFTSLLAGPLAELDLGWLYFVYCGIMAVILSVVGSIFMSQSCLYEATDNDLLLSLPIPPRYILFVRMAPLYAQNFLFGAVVLIPACISWCVAAAVSAAQVILWILIIITQPFLSLFITCLLGLLISLITSRMRNKSLFTVLLSMVFLVAYFILYTRLINYVAQIIEQSVTVGANIKGGFYPLYKFGTACMGDFVGFIIHFALCALPFALLYVVLSKTYIKLVTSKRGRVAAKYNGKVGRQTSPMHAYIRRETRRYFTNGAYLLNSGLGVVLLFAATLIFIIKGGSLIGEEAGEVTKVISLVLIAAVAFISSMDMVTAPSISLEGKTLWILQSSPVKMWDVLKAKLILHFLVTAPAAIVCSAALAIMLQPGWAITLLMLISPTVVVSMSGVFGLVFNLLKPNLTWDNETMVIKQSGSVLLTMLTVWAAIGGGIALYFALKDCISAEAYIAIYLAFITVLTVGFAFWLKYKGTEILQKL